MRTFTAIELPAEIKISLAKIQEKLKTSLPKISWVKPENLHLSLKFIGEVSAEQADNFKQLITGAAETAAPFELKIDSLGVFPDTSGARIIWAGTDAPAPPLLQLVEELEKRFAKSGIPREHRPYRAHITLGRIKQSIDRHTLEEILDRLKPEITGMQLKFKAAGITLFESVLGSGSPVYSSLKKADFK